MSPNASRQRLARLTREVDVKEAPARLLLAGWVVLFAVAGLDTVAGSPGPAETARPAGPLSAAACRPPAAWPAGCCCVASGCAARRDRPPRRGDAT
jgi:hypothetical protein